jgi:hypothetical protein
VNEYDNDDVTLETYRALLLKYRKQMQDFDHGCGLPPVLSPAFLLTLSLSLALCVQDPVARGHPHPPCRQHGAAPRADAVACPLFQRRDRPAASGMRRTVAGERSGKWG